jgi:FolB domain-containing protein
MSQTSQKSVFKILIRDLDLVTLVGDLPDELANPQKIRINLECSYQISIPLNQPGRQQIICYAELVESIQKLCASHTYWLENLAEKIAQSVLLDNRCLEVMIRVEKFFPVLNIQSIGIEVVRKRNQTMS